MTNQQDRDIELLENWEKLEGGKYHKTVFWSDDGHHKFIVENLLAATERLTEQRVRAEMAKKIAPVVRKYRLGQEPPDRDRYLRMSPADRIGIVEEIRREYHGWIDETEPRLQRVCRVLKRQ